MPAYDAFLLLSFGGPEGPGDVLPFLENVTRGRGVPRQRLDEVAEHYYAVGGVSPISAQCRDMLAAVAAEFAEAGLDLPLYWGNRNWDPFIEDTVKQMRADGVRHAVAFATSAYSSYSACRQYLDDIDRAVAATGPGAVTGKTVTGKTVTGKTVTGEPAAGETLTGETGPGGTDSGETPRIDKIRPYFNHPGFIEPFAASAERALASLPAAAQERARLVFTAHSIPVGMAATSGSAAQGTAVPGAVGGRYAAELREASTLIAERVRGGTLPFDLVFQSRSGPPSVPWLEPDVNDHLAALAKGTGVDGDPLPEGPPSAVVAVPVGFVSDHMEVVHDLDVEAAATARALGLPFARAAAPGPAPRFAAMVRELVAELTSGEPALALGGFGPRAYAAGLANGGQACPQDCCRYAPRRPGQPATQGPQVRA
jgi:ferrochelatase